MLEEFSDDLVLIKELDSGGMGEVFLALQIGVGGFEKKVAVKRVFPHLARREDFQKMFEREISLASRLQHPNIIQVLKSGMHDGYLYYVMEYVSGKTAFDLICSTKKNNLEIPVEVASYIIVEVAKALQYAYNLTDDITGQPLKIIHRDVSPANIYLGTNGSVKLMDFGIAKAADSIDLTEAGSFKGKINYACPEQFLLNQYDNRSDLFSLGIIFYELLAQTNLFAADNTMATLNNVTECRIPDLDNLRYDMPREITLVLKKMLRKDPDERFQTAEDLVRTLQHVINIHYPHFSTADFRNFFAGLFKDETGEVISNAIQRIRSKSYSGEQKIPTASVDKLSKEDAVVDDYEGTVLLEQLPDSNQFFESKSFKILFSGSLVLLLLLVLFVYWRLKISQEYYENPVRNIPPLHLVSIANDFTPSKLPELNTWFSAQDLQTGKVSRWPSKESGELFQPNPQAQPRVMKYKLDKKEINLVFFDGKDDYLRGDSVIENLGESKELSVIALMVFDKTAEVRSSLWAIQDYPRKADIAKLIIENGILRSKFHFLYGPGYFDSEYQPENVMKIVSLLIDEKSLEVYDNQNIIFSKPTEAPIGLDESSVFSLGQEYDEADASDFFHGGCAELIIYNKKLDRESFNQVLQYLVNKYNPST